MNSSVTSNRFSTKSLLPVSIKSILAVIFAGFTGALSAQVTVGFQGGEPGDTWGFTSTGASALSLSEAQQAPNKTTGTKSLVAGGTTGGGNCFASGTGNGSSIAHTFTFNSLDISTSNFSTRTLTFSWGNRFPSCNGTGYDSGENLVFRAYHNGVAQAPVTLATGSGNAAFSIQANQYSWTIPPCVSSFYFVISVTTNRADELLFIDDVKMTAPQLNGLLSQPSAIAGNTGVCTGSTETYSVVAEPGITYTWSGLPAGASFITTNGTTASHTIGINWGTAAPGTYTLTVAPSDPCSGTGTPQTVNVTILSPSVPVTISGPTSFCSGEPITLTSSYATGNTWSPGGETTSSITVTDAGTYTVSAATPCGSVTASHTVTVTPAPEIQSVTSTPISCSGANDGSLTVISGETGLEYSLDGTNWQAGNTFGNLAPGAYTIQVRSQTGCDTVLAPVQLDDPDPVSASASNNGPYCAGEPVLLNGTTTSTGAASFSWTGPNGYTSSVQNPFDATEAGAYSLIVSVDGCSSNSSSTTVVIQAAPDAGASNTGPFCEGTTVQLNGTTTSTGMASFSWTGPNGYTSSAQNPVNATAAGTYEVVVTVGGCESAPAPTTVVIHSLPTAQASYVAPFCTGIPLQLNGSSTSTGMLSYAWTGPGGYTSAIQNPTDATAAGTYSLTVTSNGCTGPASTVTVISEAPSISVSNTGPYCGGMPTQLNGSTTASGTVSYSWTGPNGYTSGVQNPADATESGIYSLTINVNNCTNIASTVVTIHSSPQAGFTSSTPCFADSMVFSSALSTVPNPEIISNWNWNFGDGTTSAEQHPRHLYGQPGAYPVSLEVTTASNCRSVVIQNVAVIAGPEADFYFSPNTVSMLDPAVQFINTSSNATEYSWNFDHEDNVSPEESPSFSYPGVQHDYRVELIAYNEEGCTDTVYKVVSVKEELICYVPNAFTPDGDEFNQYFTPVFTSGFDAENYTLLLYNRWGQVVFESHDMTTGWDGTYQGSEAPEGTYAWNIVVKQRQTDAFETISGQVTLLR